MADYATLKAAIQAVIRTNGNEEITGAVLQQSLLTMIDSLGAGYQFMGVASTSTNPGTPDQNGFYLAFDAGTYSNFGGTTLGNGQVGVFSYNGSWTYTVKTIAQDVSWGNIGGTLSNQTDLQNALNAIEDEAANTVKYTSQSLTDAQKTQARTNLGAASEADLNQLDLKIDGGQDPITPTVGSVSSAIVEASGTQTLIQPIGNSNNRIAFFPVESGKTYKLHVASTRGHRAWGWCDNYISTPPSNDINLGGLVSTDTTSIGNTYDKVITNSGGYSYLVVAFTANSGGATLHELTEPEVVCYTPQIVTDAKKTVARQNIGAVSPEDVYSAFNDIDKRMENNYLAGAGQTYVSKKIYGLIPGRKYRVLLHSKNWDITGITGNSNYKFLIRNDYNGSYTVLAGVLLPDKLEDYYDVTLPDNSDYVTIGGRAAIGAEIDFNIIDITEITSCLSGQTFIFSINHRGYSTAAPENTLPAYIMSRKKGFTYVETDVSFTSDEVPVLLHDSTINRTGRNMDGTAIGATTYIYDITYAQALQYDFGIWKGAEWAGTPIPTFRQFIQTCKEMSLHPFIELKDTIEWTQTRCEKIADDIRAVGMEENVSFISFDDEALARITQLFPKATIGLGAHAELYNTDDFVGFLLAAQSLKTQTNRVLVSLSYSQMTTTLYEMVEEASLNSIVWTVNSVADATNLNDNTVGVLSDKLNAGLLIMEQRLATLP